MQAMSDNMEPAGVIRLQHKSLGQNDFNIGKIEYDKDTGDSSDEVLIVCSVICDENDRDTNAEVNMGNKVTSYNQEKDGEKIMVYSDLRQLPLLMQNDQVKLDCISPSVVSDKNENKNSLYICQICNKHLRHHTSMEYHVLKHTGHKPHACSMCDRKYTLYSYLKLHMKKHDSENLPCPFCDEEFSSELDLRNHLHTHLVDNMLNVDQNDEDNKRSIDNITEMNTPDERLSGFSKPGHEPHRILGASSDDNDGEETGLSINGYSGDTEPGEDPLFMDISEQIHPKDDLPNLKTVEKTVCEEHYKGSQSEAENLLNELKADIDQELFDLQEVDFQETDECVQFLMSKVSEDFKHLIKRQTWDIVNQNDSSLKSQYDKVNIDVNNDDIAVEASEEMLECGVELLTVKTEHKSKIDIETQSPNGNGFSLIKKKSYKSEANSNVESEPPYYDDPGWNKNKHSKMSYSGAVYAKRFANLDSVKCQQAKYERGIFRCDHCNMDFGFKNINDHMKFHFNRLVYCTFCSMPFQEFDQFKEHERTHTGNTKSRYRYRSDKRRKRKRIKIPCRCYICKKMYSCMSNLRRHIQTRHFGNNCSMDEKVPCPVCNKIFDRRTLITEHMHVYENSLALPQSYAGTLERSNKKNLKAELEFTVNERYASKLKIEEEVKIKQESEVGINLVNIYTMQSYKFKCKICFKTWWQRKGIKHHLISTHFKEKIRCKENFDIDEYIEKVTEYVEPLLCDHCNKPFKSRQILDHHILTHYPKHTFVCDICNAIFHRRCFLRRHKLTHSDNKTVECKNCGKCFKSRKALNRHKKGTRCDGSMLQKKSVQCHLCGCRCKNQLTWKSHLHMFHKLSRDQIKDAIGLDKQKMSA